MDEPAKILIVDDDISIADLLAEILEGEGFATAICHCGKDALAKLEEEDFQLIILDIMMPGMSGLETCQRIRETSNIPVIFLSAKNEEADTVIGLSLGGDDYITKPFKPRELVARVRARMRRSLEAAQSLSSKEAFDASGLFIDRRCHIATLHDMDLALTPKEFAILSLLAEEAGKPVPIKEIFESIWEAPYNSFDSNTIMVHIRRIRKKMAAIDSSQDFIETVFGVGYKLTVLDRNEALSRSQDHGTT